MPKSEKPARTRYSEAEDRIIKQLSKQSWSNYEISYKIFNELGVARLSDAINQRRTRLIAMGYMEPKGPGKRYVTKEALDWHNKQFGTTAGPATNLELTEPKPNRNRKRNGRGAKNRVATAGSSQGSYTVQLLRMQRSNPDLLNLFKGLLEAGINEAKTAPDIVEDLQEASA